MNWKRRRIWTVADFTGHFLYFVAKRPAGTGNRIIALAFCGITVIPITRAIFMRTARILLAVYLRFFSADMPQMLNNISRWYSIPYATVYTFDAVKYAAGLLYIIRFCSFSLSHSDG